VSAVAADGAASSTAPVGARARYFNAYRLATYVLALYAFGHTFGAVVNTPNFGAESDAVVSTMKTVHVLAQGTDCTWYGFYRGFGILVSVFFVFSAILTWHLGGTTIGERPRLLAVTWALLLSYAGSVVVTLTYFFAVPTAFSAAVTTLLGFACIRDTFARRGGSTE
jgi:hypothetical protein